MSYTGMGAMTVFGIMGSTQKPVDVERWFMGCTISMAGVQSRLTRAGYPVAETGMPNAETLNALTAFRADHHVPSTATGRELCFYLAAIAQGLSPSTARPASWGPAPAGGAFLKPGWRPSTSSTGKILQPGWRPSTSSADVMTEPQPSTSSGMSPAMKLALIGGAGLVVAGGVYFVMRRKR